MNNLYDNGTMVLGQVNKVIEYLIKYNEEEEYIEEIIEDLKELTDDTIVAINYDCGMGYSIDYWDEKDIVK